MLLCRGLSTCSDTLGMPSTGRFVRLEDGCVCHLHPRIVPSTRVGASSATLLSVRSAAGAPRGAVHGRPMYRVLKDSVTLLMFAAFSTLGSTRACQGRETVTATRRGHADRHAGSRRERRWCLGAPWGSPRRSPLSESVLSPRLTAATAMALARAVFPAGREGRHHPHRTQTCLGVPSGAPCGGLARVRAGPPRAACPGRPAVQPSWARTSQPSLQDLFSLVSPRLNAQNDPLPMWRPKISGGSVQQPKLLCNPQQRGG